MDDKGFRERIEREEAKRGRNWDAAARWTFIQDTIAMAAQQVGRNTPAACLAKQRRLLGEDRPSVD